MDNLEPSLIIIELPQILLTPPPTALYDLMTHDS
jgi:hypothetical protein